MNGLFVVVRRRTSCTWAQVTSRSCSECCSGLKVPRPGQLSATTRCEALECLCVPKHHAREPLPHVVRVPAHVLPYQVGQVRRNHTYTKARDLPLKVTGRPCHRLRPSGQSGGRRQTGRIPGSEALVVDDDGHIAFADGPVRTRGPEEVAEFITRLDRQPPPAQLPRRSPRQDSPLGIPRVNPPIRRAEQLIRRHRERHMIVHHVHHLADPEGRHLLNRCGDRALPVQGPEAAAHLDAPRLEATTDGVQRLLARQPISHCNPPVSDQPH